MASKVMMRQATLKDYPPLINLWGKTFGDNESIVKRLLDEFAGEGNIYVAQSNIESDSNLHNNIVAQLLAVPCKCNGKNGAYLYALATDVNHRGQGIMGSLMEYAQTELTKKGYSFFVLIPASESLYDYYEAHDFETIYVTNIEFNGGKFLKAANNHNITHSNHKIAGSDKINDGPISAELFISLRSRLIGKNTDTCVVEFDSRRIALELEDLWLSGFNSIYNENNLDFTDSESNDNFVGYAIYLKVNDTLYISEIVANSQDAADVLILNALNKTNCQKVNITLPIGSQLFTEKKDVVIEYSEKQIPQAQFKWWGDEKPDDIYIRFALDDLATKVKEGNNENNQTKSFSKYHDVQHQSE